MTPIMHALLVFMVGLFRSRIALQLETVELDLFTVPTVSFRVLFVMIVRVHERRRVVHFNVAEHPTAQWTAQQLVEAFPWATPPTYLLRDRDAVSGK